MPPGGVLALLRAVERLARPFHRDALVLVALGLVVGGLDVVVPVVGARAVNAMVEGRTFASVAGDILAVAPVLWITHGNLLPWAIRVCDTRRYRLPLLERVSTEAFRGALAAGGGDDALVTQAILAEGRMAVDRLAGCVVRQIPAALRALVVMAILLYVAPAFVPVLFLFGAADLAIAWLGATRCRERFRRRDLSTKRQLRIEGSAHKRGAASALVRHAAVVRHRVAAETAAEVADAHWTLARTTVANLGNVATWLFGAFYVTSGWHPVGDFLFFVAWSTRAGELFGSVVVVRDELVRSRHPLEQLVRLAGGAGAETRNAPRGLTLRGARLARWRQ